MPSTRQRGINVLNLFNRVTVDHPQVMYISFDAARSPFPSGARHVGKWWITHPEHGLVLWRSKAKKGEIVPQCHPNEHMAKGTLELMFDDSFEAKFIELAYIPAP